MKLAAYLHIKTITLLICCVTLFTFPSCNNGETYADQLKKEKELINNYIKRSHIRVISTAPSSDTAWDEDEYINPSGSMYFNLSKAGTGIDSIQTGNVALVRFKSYTLGENPDSILNWSTVHYPNPAEFTFGNTAEACEAWHLAISYMKKMNSEAYVIVPSKMGFTSSTANPYWGVLDDEGSATPRLYHLKLQFVK